MPIPNPLTSRLPRTACLFGFLFITALYVPEATAAEIHVSPAGTDKNPGTLAAPLRTLAAARDAARKFAGKESVVVHVADGVYYLPETLAFTPADSGTAGRPVIYQAEREGGAILSGGLKLDLKWEPYRDGIFKAATPVGLNIDQMFINGKNQRMARYPNYDPNKPTDPYQGYAADAISKERAARWADPAGGYIHAMHAALWGGYEYRITGKNPDGSLAYEGGWQNNRQMGMHPKFRMVENIFEELDTPGEWFHNSKTNTLYYEPEPGTDLAKATVEIVRLRHLVEFQGSRQSPVRFITLKGFVFRHAARTFMDTKEPLLRSDWTIYRGGALFLTGTEDVHILDSEFDQLGGNAIFISNYNRRASVKGCHIHDAGASGVCFVGDPKAVREPLLEYNRKHDSAKSDRTPGPKTDNYPADCAVEDCLIHGIGRVERQPAGVEISMSQGITVRDMSIYDCVRAGINISEGTWGGHLIERVDVFDTVLETSDHGSFNSWGRDRYWPGDPVMLKKEPGLPFLDAMKTTVIRDSRWRCDHGWDIDLDDGSTHYDIYNNLMLRGGLKLREGFRRHAWNNIMVNSGLHPHVWFSDSGDEVYANIVMTSHKGVNVPTNTAKGRMVDHNFFACQPGMKDRYAKFGWDVHSLAGDPLFVNPAKGDFRVKEESPALKIGFKNFPMDQFGVKKPSLKAIAKTPEIPALAQAGGATSTNQPISSPRIWLGATLHGLEGEEFSAFGVSREDGGVQLVEAPAGSQAALAGLRKNDLIQALNGRKVSGTADLFAAINLSGDAAVKATLVRNQARQSITLAQSPYLLVETAANAGGFSKLVPSASPWAKISANHPTNNDPLPTLVDGKLAAGYGPVFPNGVGDGAYKMDLGASKPVSAITSWSFNQDKRRGRQNVTIYGSNATVDPGWNTMDGLHFTALGTLDTTAVATNQYLAASLRARPGKLLGSFRWIVWRVFPVTPSRENTAFQELGVETTAR